MHDYPVVLRAGGVEVDGDGRRVRADGREVSLTPTEFRLLRALIEARGTVQTRKELLRSAWDIHVDIETRTVDMYVQRLRRKLGPAGRLIVTARGSGYCFRDA